MKNSYFHKSCQVNILNKLTLFHLNRGNLYLTVKIKIENTVKVKINFTDIVKYLSTFSTNSNLNSMKVVYSKANDFAS